MCRSARRLRYLRGIICLAAFEIQLEKYQLMSDIADMSNNARRHTVKVDDSGLAMACAVSRPRAATHRMRLQYENKDTAWQFEIMAKVIAAVKTLDEAVLTGRVRVATKRRHDAYMPATKTNAPSRTEMLQRLQRCLRVRQKHTTWHLPAVMYVVFFYCIYS